MISLINISLYKTSGIYIIKSTIDSRVYIGSAVDISRRFKEHLTKLKSKHFNKKLDNFYKKYGKLSLSFDVLELCSKEQLIEREQYYLDKYNSVTNGFNISPTAGNVLGMKLSKEAKEKISKANKGKKHSKDSIISMLEKRRSYSGLNNPKNKLNIKKIILIKKMILLGYSNVLIGKYFNISEGHISKIRHNYNWKDIIVTMVTIEDKIKIKSILGIPRRIKNSYEV